MSLDIKAMFDRNSRVDIKAKFDRNSRETESWARGRMVMGIRANDRNISPEHPRCHSDEFGDWMDERFGTNWTYWSYDDDTNELILFVPDEEAALEVKLVWG